MILRAFALLALLAPAVAACSVNPATGGRTFTGFMDTVDEARVGREQHPRILHSFGGAYADPRIQDYVAHVGGMVAQVSEQPDLDVTFTVLDSPVVNAFALPGGYIYVTRGLLALVSSEAELAAVLAHELGHLTARHAAQRYSQQVVAGFGAVVLGADLASFGVATVLQSYSRDQEFEADTLAIRYLGRSGYAADAVATLFAKLDRHARLEDELAGRAAGEIDSRNIMATHPHTMERVQRAAANGRGGGGRHGRERYLQAIDGLTYGDNPEHGLVRGRNYIHQKLAIRFEVPPGFRLVSGSGQVVAHGPDGAAIAYDSVGAEPITMSGYLRDVWGRSLKLDEIASLALDGLEAASATARVQARRGPVDLRMVAIRQDGSIHRFLILAPPAAMQALAPELRRTIRSFRALTPSEATAVAPKRIRLHTVRPEDSRDGLALLMAPEPRRERRFEVINGIEGVLPAPGTAVKLISE